jgi:hypothetical protein
MDIDLLLNKNKDIGLVSTGKFEARVSGAIFDHATHSLSLEFGETMDTLDLNVPVGDDLIDYLSNRNHIFLIGTDKKHIYEAYRIPLMHVNDYSEETAGEWS